MTDELYNCRSRVASLSHLLTFFWISGSSPELLQLSWHFLPAPQDSLLPASLFIPLGTCVSLLAPEIWYLLTLCAFINFIYQGCLTDSRYDFQETFLSVLSADIYRAGWLIHKIILILFMQSVAQLTDIYRGLLTPISINPGLLQDVFYWYTVKYKNFESY